MELVDSIKEKLTDYSGPWAYYGSIYEDIRQFTSSDELNMLVNAAFLLGFAEGVEYTSNSKIDNKD